MICARFLNVALKQYSTLLRSKPTNEITVPVKMQEKLQKAVKRKQIEKLSKAKKPQRHSPVTILCKRSEYNHHHGQPYSDFNPQMLASHGWKNKKSKGDYFTINFHQRNPAFVDVENTFEELAVDNRLIKSLTSLGISSPTNIQALAIPEILKGENTLIAAETGSGKTLAYLLPILQQIWQTQSLYQMKTQIRSPQAVVLVPSKELAHQVYSVGLHLCQSIPLKIHCTSGGQTGDVRWYNMAKVDFDLLISTPKVFRKLVGSGIYSTNHLQHVVLDEADTLLDDSFNSLIRSIFHTISPRHSVSDTAEGDLSPAISDVISDGTQVIICGATLPRSLDTIIGDFVPVDNLQRITTDHVHRLLPHVPQMFMRVGLKQKPETLLKLARTNQSKGLPTLVFCNKTSTCFYVHKMLLASGVNNVMFSGGRTEREREGKFEKFQKGEYDIVVATDVASRGLDTRRAQHVINYDLPNFMSDYIHRAGRVGRVSSATCGHVVSFVSYKWDVELLWEIERSARKMTELHNVNANIKRKLNSRYEGQHGL